MCASFSESYKTTGLRGNEWVESDGYYWGQAVVFIGEPEACGGSDGDLKFMHDLSTCFSTRAP